MSVTEQMVLHAQEFNVRINQVEQLVIDNQYEIRNLLLDLVDKIEILEIRLKESHYNALGK